MSTTTLPAATNHPESEAAPRRSRKGRGASAAAASNPKVAAIDAMVAKIESGVGKGTIMRLGKGANTAIETVSTGSLALDKALGVGGLPRGRIVEIFGPESSGKTTLALHVMANAQARGGIVALIDAEHAFDPSYGRRLGLNLEQMIVSQPDCGEQGLTVADELVQTNQVDVVVVDSVAALVPRAELEGEMGDSHMGLQARLMSQALRKLTANVARSKTILIFINQLREKIGVIFGNPETTPGGKALKYYASVRLDIRRIKAIKSRTDELMIGNRTKVTVAKNKVAPPFGKCEFDIMFGVGIDGVGELLDLGTQFEIVSKQGSWFALGDERLGQGRENARNFLADGRNQAMRQDLRERLLSLLYPPETLDETPDETDLPDAEPSTPSSAAPEEAA